MRRLSEVDIRALIRLMADTDRRTSDMARSRLLRAEVTDVLPRLAEAVSDPDALVRGRARLFLEQLRLEDLKDRWAALAGQPDEHIDLEEGAMLVARYRYPEQDLRGYSRWLDEAAANIAVDLDDDLGMYRTIGVINMHLFEKIGFRGDDVRYYDPDNSCINRVIARKRGNPITLCVIYLLIGTRLGLPLHGVGMPGHFVVKYEDEDGAVWIDPFHSGRLLSREDCVRHVRSMGYPFRSHFLKPTKTRGVLARMLANLQRIYNETEQPLQAQHMKEFQDILTSTLPGDRS